MFSVALAATLDVRQGQRWAQDAEELQSRLDGLPNWFHSFAFSNGAVAIGRDPSARKLRALGLPKDMSGVEVLDVGAYDGFFSYHLAQVGARVTANDHHVWTTYPDGSKDRFDLVGEATGLCRSVETLDCDFREIPSSKWDVTLFLGVLYHLEDPIEALREMRKRTRGVVVLETLVDQLQNVGSAAAYYSGTSLNGDPTNQFGPNLEALRNWCSTAGFARTEFVSLWDVNTVSSLSGGQTWAPMNSGRVVVWAYV